MTSELELCRCGHYDREHSYNADFDQTTCSGNTRAYPDDAERDRDGREWFVQEERPRRAERLPPNSYVERRGGVGNFWDAEVLPCGEMHTGPYAIRRARADLKAHLAGECRCYLSADDGGKS